VDDRLGGCGGARRRPWLAWSCAECHPLVGSDHRRGLGRALDDAGSGKDGHRSSAGNDGSGHPDDTCRPGRRRAVHAADQGRRGDRLSRLRPGRPHEAARLAERYGVNSAAVAFAQAIRIVLLVITIPPLLFWLNNMTGAPSIPPDHGQDHLGAAFLLCGALACGGLAARLRMPNGGFLGALAFSAVAAYLTLPVAAIPSEVLIGGQVLLGVSLGSMFDHSLMGRLRRFALASIAATLGLLVLSAIGAALFAVLFELPWQTMVLATAPGSLTEMALTAKLMHADVPMVTAFHILRISIILLATPAVFPLVRWLSLKLGR
jgi:uncharacterized protein